MLALLNVVQIALNMFFWIIVGSAIYSWLYVFNVINTNNHVVAMIGDFLYRVTEPALRPIRRFMPDLGGIDISPVILLLLIMFLQMFLESDVRPLIVQNFYS